VTEWGAPQNGHWNGNGFGYIDYFVGKTGIPERQSISTRGWEVLDSKQNWKAPEVPDNYLNGFYPFESNYPTSVYGAYIARPDVLRVLIGTISYGKGTIVLDATYPVDDHHPLNDLLFYNIISYKINK
jgi:hypothetical protein